jgi:signal transduction histidine kinase
MRTVLFVDDEPEVLSSLKRLLRTETYDLLFAQSAREALDLLERERVHVIVVDLRMPEMDGFELLKRVEQKYPDIIRMVLSGRDDRDSILNAINSGNVYRYIVKPSDNMELRLIVRQAIDVFNLQQEKRDLLKKLEEHNRLLETRVQERTSQLLAIRSQAEIGKYASQIVHNMNNSLLVMQGRLYLADLELSEASPDLNELEKDVQSIKSSVDDMEKIVAGILIHARDNTRCRTEEIEINEIIKRELDFFEADPVYKYQVSKHINLSDNLPPIRGDAIQIKQIADNLIKNAIDAMENSPEKKLIVETFSDDNTVAIRISDTGEGISEENLARIFSPDFTTKPIGKGTGLGLASVRTMVDAYSGEIQVESKKGVGTTFTVRLPAGKLVESLSG